MQDVVATQYQIAKTAYTQNMREAEEEHEQTRREKEETEMRMEDVTKKIKAYLDLQKERVDRYRHDMTTPADTLRDESEYGDFSEDEGVEALEKAAEDLLEVFARVLFDRENLAMEKKRCLEILKVKGYGDKLDILLRETLLKMTNSLAEMKKDAEVCSKVAKQKEKEIQVLKTRTERQITKDQLQILQQHNLIAEKEDQVKELERKLDETQEELEDAISDVIDWRKRCEVLEKTRRMGYYNPDWNKSNNINDSAIWKRMWKYQKAIKARDEKMEPILPMIEMSGQMSAQKIQSVPSLNLEEHEEVTRSSDDDQPECVRPRDADQHKSKVNLGHSTSYNC